MDCFIALIAWVLAAAWIYILVMMVVEGEIDLIECILGIGITFWLGYTALNPFYRYAPFVSLTVLGLATLLTPVIRSYSNRKAHAKIDAELVERACYALEFDPKNFGAEIDLAQMCYKYNLLEPAVAHLERAVQMAPLYTLVESKYLKDWKRELAQIKPDGMLVCMGCGARNSVERIRCHQCGKLLLAMLIGGKWMPEGMSGKILRVWLIAAVLGISAPFLANSLPAKWALPAVTVLFILALLAFWQVVKR